MHHLTSALHKGKIEHIPIERYDALRIAERSASNPIRNFTNPSTLGYFSAYHSTRQIPLRFAKESLEFYDDLMESKK